MLSDGQPDSKKDGLDSKKDRLDSKKGKKSGELSRGSKIFLVLVSVILLGGLSLAMAESLLGGQQYGNTSDPAVTTQTQAPASTQVTTSASPVMMSNPEYKAKFNGWSATFVDVVNNVNQGINDYDSDSINAMDLGTIVETQQSRIVSDREEIQSITPPTKYTYAHDRILKAHQYLESGLEEVNNGLVQSSMSNTGLDYINTAVTYMNEATTEMNRVG